MASRTRHYCEHFLPVPSSAEAFDTEFISLVRGVNEALLLKQRTIHIRVENVDIANAILKTDVTKDTINTKYHRLMLLDSLAKTEWTGLRYMSVCSFGKN